MSDDEDATETGIFQGEERRQFVRRSEDVQLLAYKTRTMEADIKLQTELMHRLHDRGEAWNKELQDRIHIMELQMPMLLAVRGWMINGVLGLLAIIGAAVVAMVIKI